ncbi:hypothetical protein DFP72DRAFT_810860 [Ephemerocybe angulata]|uniref:Transposase n=1 Tax=Ephemerocybe angulata TaxID=980116 RepID=A0A8H6I1I5_9AGAR|nr:hypothetical protein DFP72DRAFT_810860 [Tulosesus angulatus]
MHLTGLLVPQLIIELFTGTMTCHAQDDISTWDWAVLTGPVWTEHGEEVERFRQYLPGSFDRPPRNIAKKINSGYKAREFLSYFFGYLPGMLYNVLPAKYWQNLCKLVRGVRIVLQRSVTPAELEEAFQLLASFVYEFEVLYVQRKACRIHFVHQSIHNLVHLPPDTQRVGPMKNLAQWTIERAIGDLGAEIKQPSNPYKNLSERGLRRAQVNSLMAMTGLGPQQKSSRLGSGAVDAGEDYALLHPQEKKAYTMGSSERTALSQYCEKTFENFSSFGDNPDRVVKVYRWARVLLPTDQIGRTFWKESQRASSESLRCARMVKVETQDRTSFGEVMYYFQLTIRGVERNLAMISMGSDPDEELWKLSFNVLWVTKVTTGQNLAVCDIKDIASVVALLPFKERPGFSYVFEEFGCDVSHLGSALDDGEGE